MEALRAATEELRIAASGWHALAGELSAAGPAVPGLSFQPSAAAVTAIHAGVAAAGEALTARIQITAVKTTAAATAYTENETTSAVLLDVLSESL
ncbi:MAG: hypothetical protein JO045_19585 [Mycobacterium sp.]|nr:hypothetical protein [Mycobacterium sp.]